MNKCYNEQFVSMKCYNKLQNATTNTDATTNECYNEQFVSMKSGCYNEHRCYNERMLQWTVCINEIRMLQWTQMLQQTNATMNSLYQWNQDATTNTDATMNERYNERMLQWTICINKIRMLQRTQMLQQTNATMNECYNEQFVSMKSGCYNEHRCYNEREGILSADVARTGAWRVGPYHFD
jgi:hypothetical protein